VIEDAALKGRRYNRETEYTGADREPHTEQTECSRGAEVR